MADRYWVGGTGNWSDTGHWSATSGGASGASVPTSADNAIFDAASNTTAYTVSFDVAANCLDLNFAAAPSVSGTITTGGSTQVTVYGNLTLLAGMTNSHGGSLVMAPVSGTKTITSNGANFSRNLSVSVNPGTTVQLADDLTFGTLTNTMTLAGAGTFDPNGKTVTMSPNLDSTRTMSGAWTFYNLTLLGAASTAIIFNLGSNITVTGTLTLTGNSATNRILVQSSVLGTARTITAAAVALTNCDFIDITGAGVAAPFTGTILGDCLGNSGITFTTAATQYWYTTTTGTKTWSTAGNWFLGSGGTGGAGRVPLPQDNAIFDASSIGAASTTISADMPRLGKDITWTGVTNSPTWSLPNTCSVFGSVTLVSAMTVGSATINFNFYSRSTFTLTSAGKTWPCAMFINGAGASVLSLADALTSTGDRFNINSGTLTDNGYAVTIKSMVQNGTVNKTGNWTITDSYGGVPFSCSTGTWNDTAGYLKFTSTQNTNSIGLGSKTYYDLWIATTKPVSISGNNAFNNFKADPGAIVQFTAGTAQTAATYTIDGRASTGTDAPELFLPGDSTSYFSSPTKTITGNWKASFDMRLFDYTPSANSNLINKLSGNDGFAVRLLTTGHVQVQIGNGAVITSASYGTAFTDGTINTMDVVWTDGVGFTVAVNGGAPSASTPLVATLTNAAVDCTVGSLSSGSVTGAMRRVTLTDNGATTYYNCDASRYTGSGSTFVASSGETWTRNGNAQFTGTNLVTLMGATNAAYTMAVTGAAWEPKFVSYRNATFTAAKNTTHFSLDGGSNTNITFTPARYAVAASASVNWNTTASWALGSGGASGAAVPTATEDVCFDNKTYATAYTFTVDATANCKDLMFGAAPATSGTVTLAGSAALNVYGSLQMLTGMSRTYSGNITFSATSGTKTVTSNNVGLPSVAFNGVGGTWQLVDNFTISSTGATLALVNGAFDPNGKTVTTSGTTNTITGAFNFYNLTLTGSGAHGSRTISSNITVSNLLTATGFSAAVPLLIQSSVLGTPRTITAGTVSLTNCDFMDITGAGAAAPFTGTSLGDALGNSGITFTPAVTQYWYTTTTGTKTWSTAGNWFLGSGGSGGAGRVPLPQDNVIFDANSIGAASTTIYVDMPRLGKDLTSTGILYSTYFDWVLQAIAVHGSVDMTGFQDTGSAANGQFGFVGRSAHTITSGGFDFHQFDFRGYGGTYTLQDAFLASYNNNNFVRNNCTLDANGFSVTFNYRFFLYDTATIKLGSGTWTHMGAGASSATWQIASTATVTPGTSTLKFTDATATGKFFTGGGKTYNNVWFAGAGTGPFVIADSNTFNQLKCDNPLAPVQITAGTTQTVADWQLNGRRIPVGFTDYHTDFEGLARPKKSGEVVVHGNRRVENAIQYSDDISDATWLALNGATKTGANQLNLTADQQYVVVGSIFGAGARQMLGSVELYGTPGSTVSLAVRDGGGGNSILATITLSGAYVRYAVLAPMYSYTNNPSLTIRRYAGDTATVVYIRNGSLNDVSRASNQNPPEYVPLSDTSTGATGVHYYDTLNGNTVDPTTRVVTEAVGAAITPLATQCALQVVESTNSASSYTITGSADLSARWMWLQRATATANGRTYYAGAASKDAGNNVNWTWQNAPATATLTVTDQNSTVSGAGAVSIAAGLSSLDAADVVVAVGAAQIAAALAGQDAGDTLTAAAAAAIAAALTQADAADVLSGAATVLIDASLLKTDGSDTVDAVAYFPQADARFIIKIPRRNFTIRS